MIKLEAPEDRAEAAARDLADRGRAVTARAVREAAGVRMAVAAEVARAWREAVAEHVDIEVPPTPEDVTARLTAIWADAYRAAAAVVSPERDRLAAEAEELRTEAEALTATVTEVEAERDETAQQRDAAHKDQQTVEDQLRELNQTIRTREATITELREQNRTLASQLDALIARIPTGEKNEH